jgi:hypothetical protein
MKHKALGSILVLVIGFPAAPVSHGAEELKASFAGEKLSLNGNPLSLTAAHWAEPEKNWRTVGEMLRTALPPADSSGQRTGVTLSVELDRKASWGGLKTLLMAAGALGVPKAKVKTSGQAEAKAVELSLPGAQATGEVVDLPLSAGAEDVAMTENAGKKMRCTDGVVAGLVKQLPKATVQVKAPVAMPACQVTEVLGALNRAKAAGVAYLPVTEMGAVDGASRKEAKDAVDRALGGLGSGIK